MAYNKHAFIYGQVLAPQDLTDMDNQIAKDAQTVDELVEFKNNIDGKISAALQRLTYISDGDVVVIRDGDTEINQFRIPNSFSSSYVACEGVSLDIHEVSITDITDATVVATKTPSDSTNILRFKSNDTTVCNVTSLGKITGVGLGKATVSVMCGDKEDTCTVKVSKNYIDTLLTGPRHGFFGYNNGGSDPNMCYVWGSSGNDCVVSNLQSPMEIKPGQRLKVTLNTREVCTFRDIVVFGHIDTAPSFKFEINPNGETSRVRNARLVAQSGEWGGNVQNSSGQWVPDGVTEYVYENRGSETLYACVGVQGYNETQNAQMTDERINYLIDNNIISMLVEPM